MQAALVNFIDLYSQNLAGKNMSIIEPVYCPSIEFIDPAHRVSGLEDLITYFNNMMANVSECRFAIHDVIEQEGSATISWTMHCAHPKLNGGKSYQVAGMSHLCFDERIYYHRDYFDLGSMVYEHIPLLGTVVRKVKEALAR